MLINPTQPTARIKVTEYLELGALSPILRDPDVELSWLRRIGFCLDASAGLDFLHAKNLIHRDIKSTNLLVSKEWVVKVGDFGT